MLKIHQVFILKFLLLFIGTFIVSSIISYVTLKSIVIDNNKKHLKNAIVLVNMEIDHVDDLDLYAHNVSEKTGLRVTVVDHEGIVIAESNTDKESMENHWNRYEIMQANEVEFAYTIRYSHTLKIDFLYIAKKSTYKGEDVYIRLSMGLEQILRDFYSLWSKFVLIFLIIILIAYYASKKMSDKILYDIEQIIKYLESISNKNYKAVIKTKYFNEFLQISLGLKNLVKKLSNREKQKRKYTAKLRLMNKQRNDILSAISHEFKNPVASIIGYAQTLQDDPDIDLKVRDKFLDKIGSNGEKISKMLDRLALSVKLENNDLDLIKNEFDLKHLCEEVSANILSKYKGRDIIIDAEETIIVADKTMIELTLVNLIDNALKYSQDDVEVVLNKKMLCVKDKGIGIKPEHIDQVTSKFYRVQKNTWDNSMGIGLAMVSYILRAHKSELMIESEFAKGSEFSFSIEKMLKK